MVQADYLFLMTDVDCLYDKNPRVYPDAQAIETVEDISSLAVDVSSAGSALGTGGMSTKIIAAQLAKSAGVTTVITRSSTPGNILGIVTHYQAAKKAAFDTPSSSEASIGDLVLSRTARNLHPETPQQVPPHTRFLPDPHPIRDRSFWLLHGLAPHGTVYIDEGAHRALLSKAGLLPAGVVDLKGHFAQQEAVRVVVVHRPLGENCKTPEKLTPHDDPPTLNATSTVDDKPWLAAGLEVGRALVNYSSTEITRIKGLQSTEIQGMLGYADSDYVALRENVSLTTRKTLSRPATPPRPGPVAGNETLS
jgi:glutamate 5-kinase